MKKNNLKRKLIVIGGVLLSIIIIITAVSVVRELNAEKILKEEVNKITNIDFTVDEIDMHIKTKKNYAVVEKTIKDFWNEYHSLAREIIELTNDDKLKNILSIENYELDGKDFTKTKEYISTTQGKIEENISKIIALTNKDTIEKKIEDKNLPNHVDSVFNYYTKVIDFLVTNQSSWTITNDKLEFTSESLANQYNTLIKEK